MSKVYPFQIERGSTKVITLNYTDSNGTVIDLTNYSARMALRETPTSNTVALELHSTGSTGNNSGLAITGPSGSIEIYISAADTNALNKDVYFYDLEIYTAADPYSKGDPEYVERLMEGTIITKYNITQ